MSVQSGPSVAITAFGALPEQIQKQHLENDAQRDRLAFDLEQKQIEAQIKEREAERAHDRSKWERSLVHHETNNRRAFWFVVGAGVAAIGGTVALFAFNRDMIAAHLVNTLIAGGLGYQGGKSAGMPKVGSQSPALPVGKHDDDK